MQMNATLGPKVHKQDLLCAVWSPRAKAWTLKPTPAKEDCRRSTRQPCTSSAKLLHVGVSMNWEARFRSSSKKDDKDHSISWLILGPLLFWKPPMHAATPITIQGFECFAIS